MSSIDRSYNEKRDFIRMRINSPVYISQDGNDYTGVCKDLSGAGMLIETSHEFTVGANVGIAIPQQSETHLPFNAVAEVSRVEAGPGDNYIVGLSITDIQE